jgi:hypothetical protein
MTGTPAPATATGESGGQELLVRRPAEPDDLVGEEQQTLLCLLV